MHQDKIKSILTSSISVKQAILNDVALLQTIETVVEGIVTTFQKGNKVLFCGNGGSAADAQHLAAEFSGRFYTDRAPLPSEALHCNTSFLTAVGNDYGYEFVYSRMMRGIGKPGDMLIGLSTSGNSPNIINAFEVCREIGVTTVGMTGSTGGNMKALSDLLINIPSTDTPRIQESHITVGHIICQLAEERLFSQSL